MAKITVIIQTYNRKKLLKRAINSVLDQTFIDYELIILDNGSTDGTEKLVSQYCEEDDRIIYVKRCQNDIGIDLTYTIDEILSMNKESKYCMFIDDDDFMEKNALEVLFSLIITNDADVASVGSKYIYNDERREDKYTYEGIFVLNRLEAMLELLKREKINSARGGKLYRKNVVINIEYPIKEKIRDIHREYRVINRIKKMAICGEPLYYFSRHGSNSSGLNDATQITEKRLQEHLKANRIRTIWLSEKMPEISEFVLYSELSFMISLYERIHRLKVESCYGIAERMKTLILEGITQMSKKDFLTKKDREILHGMMEKEY